MKPAGSRRQAVLDAAAAVIARDGLRGVTHRAVAAEMGTSVRAATYHFASIDALIEAAFEGYVARSLARFEELAATLTATAGASDAASTLLLALEGDLGADHEGLVMEYTLLLELARRPSLRPTFQRWQTALLGVLERSAAALGSDRPALHARLVLATLRGLELEALAEPDAGVDRDAIRAAFAALVDGLYATRR